MDKFKGRMIGALNKKWIPKQCFHKGVSTPCIGNIVDAHTVSKSSSLKSIAVKNHVYSVDNSFETLEKNNGNFTIKKIGIGRASVFPGFCQEHDAKLFSPFEVNDFVANSECAFLIGYRALCHELYSKMNAKAWALGVAEILSENAEIIGDSREDFAKILASGFDFAIKDLTDAKCKYDKFFNIKGNNTNFICIEFSSLPNLVCSSRFSPEYDFSGNRIQNLLLDDVATGISFSIIATKSGGAFVMQWIDNNEICKKFANSLLKFNNVDLPSVITEFAFKCSENIYMAPKWWDALNASMREKLCQYMSFNTPNKPSEANDLKPDGSTYCTWDGMVITKNY